MPAPALTGYALTAHFRKLRLRVSISPLQAYLFFELVAICNEEGWPAEFNATNPLLMAGLGCSEEGLSQARKRLREVGLIDFEPGTRRVPTRYWFTVNGPTHWDHSDAQATANPPTKGATELDHRAENPPTELDHRTTNPPTEGPTELDHAATQTAHPPTVPPTEGPTELDPYKEQTKTKRILTQSRGDCVGGGASSFEQWWAAYAKKRDRFKCEKKWASLTAGEQAAALARTPAYVAATPEKQFRKDPLTYLTGKCWLDEELPAPRHGQPVGLLPAPAAPEPLPVPEANPEFLAQQAAAAQARRQAHFAKFEAVPA